MELKGRKLKKVKTLAILKDASTQVKVNYAQVLAAQCLADQELGPEEFAELFRYMILLDLPPMVRNELREFLFHIDKTPPELVDALLSEGQDEETKNSIKFSIIKDMIRISSADKKGPKAEQKQIEEIASKIYGPQAARIIDLAQTVVEQDEKIAKGEVSGKAFKEVGKDIAAQAAAVGVSVTAVAYSGSIAGLTAGLSAAGISSALATLGAPGAALLTYVGISSVNPMTMGLAVVVLMGATTFVMVKYGLSGFQELQRKHMVEELLKFHQKCINALSQDITQIMKTKEEIASKVERDEGELSMLEEQATIMNAALEDLEKRDNGQEA